MSWNKRSQKCSIRTKSLFQCFCTNLFTPVSKRFSFAKIINPPNRCGISSTWFNSMLITQVHLVLRTIKSHSNVQFCHTTQCHRCLKFKFWGSVQFAFWLEEFQSELLNVQCLFIELAVRLTGLTAADHVCDVVWASGLLRSRLWTECPMLAVGLWYGKA
jgi:hypothetical protein